MESFLKVKLLLKFNTGKDKTFGCFFHKTNTSLPLREILCAILKGENPCLTKEVLLSDGVLNDSIIDGEFGNLDTYYTIHCRVKDAKGEWIGSPLEYPPMIETTSTSVVFELIQKTQDNTDGAPYIPSYMDLSNGPEPCVVCGDAATGYHYRCMTCEGCKGFFRRTIQKNLSYYCKWNEECIIDKTTRNQCQQCRYKKCIAVGMDPDLVLNENQRKAKRRLIKENRDKRQREEMLRQTGLMLTNRLTDGEEGLINAIVIAHRETSHLYRRRSNSSSGDEQQQAGEPEIKKARHSTKEELEKLTWQSLAYIMTPSIVKVVKFAKRVPGFTELQPEDQVLLLKSCCMEITCLRIAQKYDPDTEKLVLSSGVRVDKSELNNVVLSELVEPIFDFAVGLSRLELTDTEMALLAAVLLIAGDRPGLKEPRSVEQLQDTLLSAFQHFINETRPKTPVHWAKILMKITDLRMISARHAERIMTTKLDRPQEIPQILLEMFDDCNTSM